MLCGCRPSLIRRGRKKLGRSRIDDSQESGFRWFRFRNSRNVLRKQGWEALEYDSPSSCDPGDGGRTLPVELVWLILSKLPPEVIFKFRSVCKQWNSTLRSRSFLRMCSSASEIPPYCMMNDAQGFAIYNFASRFCRYSSRARFLSQSKSLEASSGSIHILATAAGLFLLNDERNSLYIANPTNKWYRHLPHLEGQFSRINEVYSMSEDRETQSVKVLFIDRSQQLHSYDLRTNCWELVGTWALGIAGTYANSVYHKGYWYFLTLEDSPPMMDSGGRSSFTAHVYRVRKHAWEEIQTPPEVPVRFAHLAQRGDRVILIEGITQKPRGVARRVSRVHSVHVWELDCSEDARWLHVLQMPNSITGKFASLGNRFSAKGDVYECSVENGHICFSVKRVLNTLSITRTIPSFRTAMVICDLSTHEWSISSCYDMHMSFYDNPSILFSPNLNLGLSWVDNLTDVGL